MSSPFSSTFPPTNSFPINAQDGEVCPRCPSVPSPPTHPAASSPVETFSARWFPSDEPPSAPSLPRKGVPWAEPRVCPSEAIVGCVTAMAPKIVPSHPLPHGGGLHPQPVRGPHLRVAPWNLHLIPGIAKE